MKQQPQVSVIIIFLNAGKFLQEAIESVFSQSYGCWELLLVDDGSTDSSTEVALQYLDQYPDKVRTLTHAGRRNLGMSASRNLGIRHAKGKYIALLDADDVWFAATLEEQVATLEAQPEAAMVYGPLFWWYSWSGAPEDSQRDYIEQLGVPANTLIRQPRLLPLFLMDKAAVPSGLLIRREIIEQVGGFEETFRGEYEDQVFCAKLCLHAPVFASERCWYQYRQHPDSSVAIGQKTGNTYQARLIFLTWLGHYLREQKVKDSAVWWAYRQQLWLCRYPRFFHLARQGRYFAERVKHRVGIR